MIKRFRKIVYLLPFILLVNFIGIIVYYAVNFSAASDLQNTLIHIEPIFLLINFIAIAGLFIINFKDIRKCLKGIKKNTWILLLLIFILAFFLRMYMTPHTHRVFFDEDIYLDIGKNILTDGKACLCNYGDNNTCYECPQMKWPSGHTFLISVAFLFFGTSENTAFILVSFLGSLSAVLVFLAAFLILNKEKIALYAAFLFSLVPVHIMWSGTAASEPVMVFFTLLTIFSFALSFKTENWKMYALAISVLAYALQIRSEGIIILPVIIVMTLLLDNIAWKRFTERKFLLVWAVMFILITPYLIHTYYFSQHDPWGSDGKMFGFEYTARNVPENAWFWIAGYEAIEHPILFTVFMIIGLAYLLKKDRRAGLFLLAWFIAFFMLYGFFYAGSVRYGADVRYALSGYPPYMIVAGYGMYVLTTIRPKFEKIASFVIAAVILFSIFFYLPSVSTPAEDIREARQARLYHDFATADAGRLDSNCYILTHVPSMYLINNVNALQTWYGSNQLEMDKVFNMTDCVVFDNGFWCNIEPYKSSVCKHMFDYYALENISSISVDNHEYSLYYVRKK